MKLTAPQRNEAVLITEFTDPPLVLSIDRVLGFDSDRQAWNVSLNTRDEDDDEGDSSTIASRTVLIKEKPLQSSTTRKTAKWQIINAKAPLEAVPDYGHAIQAISKIIDSLNASSTKSEVMNAVDSIHEILGKVNA
jgi:hypothetical protein